MAPTKKSAFGNLCLFLACAFILSGCNGLNSLGSWNLPGLGQPGSQSGGQSGGYNQQRSYSDFPSGRPANFQAFKDRYQTVGTSPEGAVRMYFDALYSYIDPARKAEGAKMLRYSLHEGKNWEKSPALATFAGRLKDPSFHYIFRSFAEGASPENSYAMNPDDYRLMFAGSRQESDYLQISVWSSGADSPRPLHVRQFEDGLWYVINNHGTYTEVRKPANQIRTGGHDADQD